MCSRANSACHHRRERVVDGVEEVVADSRVFLVGLAAVVGRPLGRKLFHVGRGNIYSKHVDQVKEEQTNKIHSMEQLNDVLNDTTIQYTSV